MQNGKFQVMFELYSKKFLNDNLVLHAIQLRLQIFSEMLELLDRHKHKGKPDSAQLIEALMRLRKDDDKRIVQALVQDTQIMQAQNERAVRDAVSGDIEAYIHELPDNEPYSISRTKSRWW